MLSTSQFDASLAEKIERYRDIWIYRRIKVQIESKYRDNRKCHEDSYHPTHPAAPLFIVVGKFDPFDLDRW